MRGLGLLLRRALPALVLWGAAGCELLINGQVTAIHCADEGKIGPGACPAHQVCEQGVCVDLAQREHELGDACEGDTDCAFGDFCLDLSPLDLPSGKRCTRACCSSSGCDPAGGLVCWSPPEGGGSLCVSAAVVDRAQGGTAASGEACGSDSDCRSGRCDDDGTCVDPCCSDTACALAGGTCQLLARGKDEGFFCGPHPDGRSPYLTSCEADDDCDSGLCHDFGGDVGKRCSAPCCSSETCSLDVNQDLGVPIACTYISREGHTLRACALAVGEAIGGGDEVRAAGQPCGADEDCRSGRCVMPAAEGEEGYCSDACCSDAACGEGGGLQCRPDGPDGSKAPWPLRCERK